MSDADKTLVVAIAGFAVACIGVIGQLLGQLRRARQDVGAERQQRVEDQQEWRRTEKVIDELQRESERRQAEISHKSDQLLEAIKKQRTEDEKRRLEAMQRALKAARATEGPEVRRRLYDEWVLTHKDVPSAIMSGAAPLPDDWVTQTLAKWGLETKENPTRTRLFWF